MEWMIYGLRGAVKDFLYRARVTDLWLRNKDGGQECGHDVLKGGKGEARPRAAREDGVAIHKKPSVYRSGGTLDW